MFPRECRIDAFLHQGGAAAAHKEPWPHRIDQLGRLLYAFGRRRAVHRLEACGERPHCSIGLRACPPRACQCRRARGRAHDHVGPYESGSVAEALAVARVRERAAFGQRPRNRCIWRRLRDAWLGHRVVRDDRCHHCRGLGATYSRHEQECRRRREANMNLGLANKVALVTAASRGIGRAVAYRLADEGVQVAMSARAGERLDSAAAEYSGDAAGSIKTFPLDLTDAEATGRLVESVIKAYGRIDVLVMNTPGPPIIPVVDTTLQ